MRPYEPGVIFEFDSISDLKEFDHDFIENVDSTILDNICRVLDCSRGDVEGIVPIKEEPRTCRFASWCAASRMSIAIQVWAPTRSSTAQARRFLRPLRRNSASTAPSSTRTPPKAGRSRASSTAAFPSTTTTRTTCAMRWSWVAACMTAARRANGPSTCTATRSRSWSFSAGRATRRFPIARSLGRNAGVLDALVRADRVEPCLCHNDFYSPNFLVRGEEMHLIDWEYSAMSDYASDLGTFICCSDYSVDEARHAIELYFGRTPTDAEMRHCLAYVALCCVLLVRLGALQGVDGRSGGRVALPVVSNGEVVFGVGARPVWRDAGTGRLRSACFAKFCPLKGRVLLIG